MLKSQPHHLSWEGLPWFGWIPERQPLPEGNFCPTDKQEDPEPIAANRNIHTKAGQHGFHTDVQMTSVLWFIFLFKSTLDNKHQLLLKNFHSEEKKAMKFNSSLYATSENSLGLITH